jgi:hypothetical protein
MFSNLNPQLPYYLLLFLLTIILRFIRAYRSHPKDPESSKKYRTNYLYFGFDLVFVSAGVFILLSQSDTQNAATFMILYVILVVLGGFFEEESVGRTFRTAGHIFVSLIVVAVTCYAFWGFDGIKVPNKISTTKKWRVALPYMDTSLNRNFGIKNVPIKSSHVVEVSSGSRFEAVQAAKEDFYSAKGPTPFNTKTEKNSITMIILEGDVVVELVN